MAKTNGPLMSLGAFGSIGKTIVFQRRKGTTAVFIKKTPYDLKSAEQLIHRDYIKSGVYYWHKLTPEVVQDWDDFVN